MELATDRKTRTEKYKDMIPYYYELATPLYRVGWGDSFHLMYFTGEESVAEAAINMDRSLADEGKFGPDMKILDVGSGVGGPACTIARHSGAHITGLNISPRQIIIAEELVAKQSMSEQVTFVEGDSMNMPFEDDTFDAAYALESMCHTPDKAVVCTEIARVVKPGGMFVGYDWFCRNAITAEQYDEHIEPICRASAVPYVLTLGQLETCLREAGFDVEATGNAADRGNMERCWDLYAARGKWLARRTNPTTSVNLMRELIETLVSAAWAGYFLMGYWRAKNIRS